MHNLILDAEYIITVSAAALLASPLGEQMEYIAATQTQRDIRSRLIGSGSLLSDDQRKMHTYSPDSALPSLCIHFMKIRALIKVPHFI